jgi:glyoxylase-like metal-dependent hydrolase (beta-lactamase superfamily II)
VTRIEVGLLEAGRSWQRERLARRGGSWRWIPFPATVAVLRHPDGVVLVDTGHAPRFFEATARFPERLYRVIVPADLASGEAAVDQLAAAGVAASDVTTVLLTHLHGDHLGGLRDFPAARIVHSGAVDLHGTVPGRRAPAAHRREASNHGFLPALLPDDLAARSVPAERFAQVGTGLPGVKSGWDVAGDGSIVAVDLPGHGPGHLGVWVPATQGPPVLLVGDACWSRAALTGDLPPAPVLRMMADVAAYRATIAALAALAKARPEILIVPAHCAASVATARAALAGR